MDVVGEMQAVEAAIGGRVGDAVSGIKAEAAKAKGTGAGLLDRVRGYVGGLSVAVMIALGLVGVAACATPIAVWSAYHSGLALQAERDRAAAAEAVATETARQKRVIESASAKLAKADAADKAEIKRLKGIAARLMANTAARRDDQQRANEDRFRRAEADLDHLQAAIVPRGEHDAHWADQRSRDTEIQRQVDDLRGRMEGIYSPKDKIQSMERHIEDLEAARVRR